MFVQKKNFVGCKKKQYTNQQKLEKLKNILNIKMRSPLRKINSLTKNTPSKFDHFIVICKKMKTKIEYK